jgi:hypothetical protein
MILPDSRLRRVPASGADRVSPEETVARDDLGGSGFPLAAFGSFLQIVTEWGKPYVSYITFRKFCPYRRTDV